MSDFEMLLSAWLAGGDVPEDFKPSSSIEFILIDILKGIPSTVDPKSRADVLLKAIADKYAGYADGIDDLRDVLGFTGHPILDEATTPELISLAMQFVNAGGIELLADKGVSGVSHNTLAIIDAIQDIEQGGGGITATVTDIPLISGAVPQISATVTEA